MQIHRMRSLHDEQVFMEEDCKQVFMEEEFKVIDKGHTNSTEGVCH